LGNACEYSNENKLVIEYNPSEKDLWFNKNNNNVENGLFQFIPNESDVTTDASMVVIVHGEVGGMAFIDGKSSATNNVPDYHLLVTAEELAADINSKINKMNLSPGSYIKFISCHGADKKLFLTPTAQTIANITGMNVAAYENPVEIPQTIPGEKNFKNAIIFEPKK
jgi:hypothetical protein